MKKLTLFLLSMTYSVSIFAVDFPGEFSGEFSATHRVYPQEGLFENNERHDTTMVFKPQYTVSGFQDRTVFSMTPYIRVSELDESRNQYDLRELSIVSNLGFVDIRAGISKVFWGVTESFHLVDVINQTDWVDNPSGESKLGQPMINSILVTKLGNFEVFVLPYFRERTFPGSQGRLRGILPISNDARYLHEDGQEHIDFAFRWAHYIGPLDWAFSYFEGTDRDPSFELNAQTGTLHPVYGQTRQLSAETQVIIDNWIFKAELLGKDSDFYDTYLASVTGVEYTFVNMFSRMDYGIIYEWLYDERGDQNPTGLSNTSFVGSRIAFNDAESTQIIAGVFIDNDKKDVSFGRLEASSRLSESMSWTLELNIVVEPAQSSFYSQMKRDDYVQFGVSYFY